MAVLIKRCRWLDGADDIMIKYHDIEWGVPVHSDRHLFEVFTLEGAQAGLSWKTILDKRENYRKAFDYFNIKKVAKYDEEKIEQLLSNKGIIRNRLKIISVIKNANVFIEIQKEFSSFDKYIWCFVKNKPIKNKWGHSSEIPVRTKLSDMISKDLKNRGMCFVGPIVVYSIMQTIGMVNDHELECLRYNMLLNK